ncbi:anti-repressor Ant [Vibrio phage K250 g1]
MNMQILSQQETLTMSSREISGYTDKQHQHVKRDIEKMFKELELDTSKVGHIYFDSMNRKQVEYLLDRDQTDCLLTGYSAKARMTVIKRWKELEEKQKPQLPQSFAEALQLAADQARQLELAAPKIDFHDRLVNDAATFSLRDAAKKIQQRPNKFSQWLRDEGYLCHNNLAKQQYINQGLFKTHTGTSRDEFQFNQARMTSKGLSYFTKKLGEIKL